MSAIPRVAPIICDPQTAPKLSGRWSRARSLLLISSVALTLVCVSFAGLTAFGAGEDAVGWSAIPVLAAGACTASLAVWLRRDGITDPESWVPATVLMTTSERVLGAFPGFGLTAKALPAVGVLGASAPWATAARTPLPGGFAGAGIHGVPAARDGSGSLCWTAVCREAWSA